MDRLLSLVRREPEDREGIKAVLEAAHERALLDAESYQMIRGALAVSEGIVADIMVPRSRMDLLDVTQPIPYLVASVIETAHSRFPVYEGDRDNIIGILLAKDLLRCMLEPGIEVRSLVRPAVFIPESKRLNVLLREFRVSRNHHAIVIDEHGGISGLVTMEDVLEQIVGDIEDEFDETEEDSIFPEGENQWRVRAATEISHFNDVFGSKLPDDEYDSVGGWMGGRLGRIRAAAITPKSTVCASRSPAATPAAPSGCVCDAWPGPIPPPIPPKHEPHPARPTPARRGRPDTGRRGARTDIRSRPAARLGPGHHPGAGAGRGRARDAVCAVGAPILGARLAVQLRHLRAGPVLDLHQPAPLRRSGGAAGGGRRAAAVGLPGHLPRHGLRWRAATRRWNRTRGPPAR